ncbi:Hsp70 family protein [Catenuloplanes japonicus]|uniref:Hsp70 family protein n=1 Tax=Catenuloplanes japonicus TaxID=33876 RepID=UPI000691ECBB|nr:Hsp70 family protein [Catenuloplanes japonicus]
MHFVAAAGDGDAMPAGQRLLVYDFGASTCDVTVVGRTASGFEVLARDGLDVGGLGVDAALVDYLGTRFTGAAARQWGRLLRPESDADQRAARQLWSHVRTGKEMLSRTAWTTIHVPLVDEDVLIGRAQLEAVVLPVLRRTVAITRQVVASAGLDAGDLAGVYLVGGSSRIPAVATLLHRALRIAPTVRERPELAVAEGSVLVDAPPVTTGRPAATPPPADPPPQEPPPGDSPPRSVPHGEPPAPVSPVVAPLPADAVRPTRSWIEVVSLSAIVAVIVIAVLLALAAWIADRSYSGGEDAQPPPSTAPAGPAGAPWRLRAAGVLTGHGDEVDGIAYNRDGSTLVTSGSDNVRLWNIATLTSTAALEHDSSGLPAEVAFSGDGRMVAAVLAGPAESIVVWDVASRAPFRTITVQRPRSFADLAFHPDLDLIAAAVPAGEAVLWNPRTGAQVAVLPAADGYTTTQVRFHPLGSILATEGFDRNTSGPRLVGQVRLWHSGTHSLLATLPGQQAAPTFSPDGTVLATVGTDNDVITLWDPVADTAIRTMPAPLKEAMAMAFSPDGRILAVSSRDEQTTFMDVRTGTVLGTLPEDGTGGSEHLLIFAPNGSTLATVSGAQPTVRLWTVPILE